MMMTMIAAVVLIIMKMVVVMMKMMVVEQCITKHLKIKPRFYLFSLKLFIF